MVENKTQIESIVDQTGEAWPSPDAGDDRPMRTRAERLADVYESTVSEGGFDATDALVDQADV